MAGCCLSPTAASWTLNFAFRIGGMDEAVNAVHLIDTNWPAPKQPVATGSSHLLSLKQQVNCVANDRIQGNGRRSLVAAQGQGTPRAVAKGL
jgi:hypothetical protein